MPNKTITLIPPQTPFAIKTLTLAPSADGLSCDVSIDAYARSADGAHSERGLVTLTLPTTDAQLISVFTRALAGWYAAQGYGTPP